jgi:pimeloyl-ACP methyl ester carboxylesterase
MTEATHTRGRRPLWRLLVVAVVAVGLLGLDAGTAEAHHNVEHTYEVPPSGGGFAVTWDDGSVNGCADPAAPPASRPFTYVYPSPPALGALGDHPIITWGNATNDAYADLGSQRNSACYFEDWLRLLASWGFVVVSANTGQTGSGNEMRVAAGDLIARNGNSGSVFYQKLDTTSIGAAGHSQGAIGAMNAVLDAPGVFEGVLAMSTPDREDLDAYNVGCFWYNTANPAPNPQCLYVTPPAVEEMPNLDAPIFFARNSALYLPDTDPCDEDDWISDKSKADWYPNHALPDQYLAGTVRATPPDDPADCGAAWPHLNMEDAYGYMNAWFAYTLQNQAGARPAFVGASPQFMSNPDWSARERRDLT